MKIKTTSHARQRVLERVKKVKNYDHANDYLIKKFNRLHCDLNTKKRVTNNRFSMYDWVHNIIYTISNWIVYIVTYYLNPKIEEHNNRIGCKIA